MTPFQWWELFTGIVNNIWVLDGNRRKELTLHIKFGFFTEALITTLWLLKPSDCSLSSLSTLFIRGQMKQQVSVKEAVCLHCLSKFWLNPNKFVNHVSMSYTSRCTGRTFFFSFNFKTIHIFTGKRFFLVWEKERRKLLSQNRILPATKTQKFC